MVNLILQNPYHRPAPTRGLQNAQGETALMIAVSAGYPVPLIELLAFGDTPRQPPPSAQAAPAAAPAAAEAPLPKPIDTRDAEGATALLRAVRSEHYTRDGGRNYLAVFEALLRYGADPSIADANGASPLIAAVRRGFHHVVDRLRKVNADGLAAAGRDGLTALMIAARRNDAECLRILLAPTDDPRALRNAPILTLDRWSATGFTALHYAALADAADAAAVLLYYGADVNARSVTKYTPLMWAAKHGQWYVAAVMCEYAPDDIDLMRTSTST